MSIQTILVQNKPSPYGAYLGSLDIERNLVLENVIPVASSPAQTLILGIDNSGGPNQGYVGSVVTGGGGSGVTGLEPIANPGVPNQFGASIFGSDLRLEPANASFPGVVTTVAQTISGSKTLTDNLNINKDLIMPEGATGAGSIRRATDSKSIFTNRTDNIFAGPDSGNLTQSGTLNTCYGTNTGKSLTSGLGNTLIGGNAGNFITTGSNSTCIGLTSGSNITTENNNILIDNAGTIGQSNSIHLGDNTHTRSYCEAVKNNAISGNPVVVDPTTGELGMGASSSGVSFTAVGAVPNANAASVLSNVITLQPADGTNPGVVSTTTQSFAGNKTFVGAITASNLSGTNSGNVTLATVGAAPNTSAASLSGQALTLQPADGTNPGVLTAGIQSIGGNKTFTGTIAASNLSGTNTGNVTLTAVSTVPNANGASLTGQALNLQPANATFPGVVSTGAQQFAGDKQFVNSVLVNGTIDLTGTTSSTIGYIEKNGAPFIHVGPADANQSFYAGVGAGNMNTSFHNVGVGYQALTNAAATTAQSNTAIGYWALKDLTTGTGNVALGVSSGTTLTGGDNNVYIAANANSVGTESNKIRIGNFSHDQCKIWGISPPGAAASKVVTLDPSTMILTGNDNVSLPHTTSATVGTIRLGGVVTIHDYSTNATKTNITVGQGSGNLTATGTGNSTLGAGSMSALSSGSGNTVCGSGAGGSLTTGSTNTILGAGAGSNITTGTNTILIGNAGAAADTNKILIGNGSHTGGTSIFGISGATSAGGVAVLVNASGVLGTTTSSRRFKNTIVDVPDNKVKGLHDLDVKSFYYNDDKEQKYLNYGLIAEEVEEIYPELINYEEDGVTPHTVYYQYLAPLLLKELQVQKKKMDYQDAVIKKLCEMMGIEIVPNTE